MNIATIITQFFSSKQNKKERKTVAVKPIVTLNRFVETAAKGVSTSTVNNYHTAVRSFLLFNGENDIALSAITNNKIRLYERWLKGNGVRNNTIACYLRSLRAIYNKGVAKHKVRDAKPFKGVFTGNERTVKTSLTIDDINRLVALKLPPLLVSGFCARRVCFLVLHNGTATSRLVSPYLLAYKRWKNSLQSAQNG